MFIYVLYIFIHFSNIFFSLYIGGKNATETEHLAYMKEALPILDKNSNVQRYSWMSARDNKVPGASLFTNNNNPMNP